MKNYPCTTAAAAAKSLQSCPTLCDPIDGSPPGSPVPGILQARTLEWVAISFSNTWKWKVKVKLLSRVRLLAIPWTAAYQAPPSVEYSRQEYWSGVPLPSLSILALEMTYFIMGMLPESIKNLPESTRIWQQDQPVYTKGKGFYKILCRKEQLCRADKWNTSDHCTKVQIPLSRSKGIIQKNKTFPGQLAAKSLWCECGTIICFFDIDKSLW